MDEFARMMSMEGVRPLSHTKEKSRRLVKTPPSVLSQPIIPSPELGPNDYAWVTGPRARTALETALKRLASEIRSGRRGWANGILQDGRTVTLPASSGAASLLGTADRQSLRLMIVGGDGWTFVMHPLMGSLRSMKILLNPIERASEYKFRLSVPNYRNWVLVALKLPVS